MSLWLLLVDRNDQGLAVPVSFPRHPFSRHPAGKIPIIDASIQPDEGQALWESAKKAAKQCGALLWREGYLNESGTIRFCRGAIKHGDLEANDSQGDSMGIQGSSADLLFALAFLTVAVGRGYPPLAATGALGEGAEYGWVKSVKGVPAKITAALQVLPAGSLLFYPKANQDDIPPDLHRQAEAQGVTLIAVERLEEALVRLGITIEKVYLDTPYLGLQSFSYAERSIFFGREAAIEDLQTLLLQREQAGKPGVLIVAASGAGKSSLAQAGLLPALEKAGWAQTGSDSPPKPLRLALAARPVYWTETWKPQHATERSATGLLRSIIDNWATQPLLQALPPVENLAQLADAFAATAAKEHRFLWLIDQLEELFTLSFPYDAIGAFADFLQRLQQQGVWLVAMLRNDFYSRYQEHEAIEPGQARLIDVFGGAHYDLLKPDEAALRRIIEWPAEKAGLSFETATDGSTLADHIAQDLREGGVDALPLLQFALRQLWDGRESGQNLLTFKAYQAMGRLHGAIGQKAETVYQSLPPDVQTALPKLLWDLAIVREKHGDAGQRQYDYVAQTALLSDYPEGSDGRALIEAIADETVRLLVRDGGIVRVAHEALFRHWDTAQQQLAQLHEDMAVRERVRHEYEIWCAKGKTDDLLLMPVMRLAEGEALLQQREAFLDADLVAYIRASIAAEAERQRLEQERIQREQATAEEARQQAELAQARAEQVARQQTELAEQQTQLAQERQEKAEKLKRKARQLLAAALVSVAAAAGAGWYWQEAEKQTREVENKKTELVKTLARSDFIQGSELVKQGKANEALAYLARAIRIDNEKNSNQLAVSTLVSNKLAVYNAIMIHKNPVLFATFSPEGKRIATISGDFTVCVWDAQTGEPISSPMEHQDEVYTVVFSPDGKKVLTASKDGNARVWSSQTGEELITPLKHEGAVHSAVFSPDGNMILTSSDDHTARLWETNTGKQFSKLFIHTDAVYSAIFSPDGRQVMTVAGGFWNYVARIWDKENGNLIFESTQGVSSAKFSPDGQRILTTSWDKTIRVWNLRNNEIMFSPIPHVFDAEFSPDGNRIVTNSEDNIARVLDSQTGEPVSPPMKHQKTIFTVLFSPDGRKILTISDDNTARVWDANTGEQIFAPLHNQGIIHSAEYSPNGRLMVVTTEDKTANIWNTGISVTKDNELIASFNHKYAVYSAVFSPDGRRIVTASDDKTAKIWDLQSGELVFPPLQHHSIVRSVTYSPDGKRILSVSLDNTARVWDAITGQPISDPMQHQDQIDSATFSENGKWIITDSNDGSAHIWDAQTGKPVPIAMGLQNFGRSAIFSMDESKIAVESNNNTVRVWSTQTGKPISKPMWNQDKISKMKFSSDGHRLIVATFDNIVRIWDAQTGVPISEPMRHPDIVDLIKYSPDWSRLITASWDHSVRIWNAKTGKLISAPLEHGDAVFSAEFSPDGQWIATACNDGIARIWDAQNGDLVSVVKGHRAGLLSVAFSPDGRWLLTASKDGIVRVSEINGIMQPTPSFADFLEYISGYQLNAVGGLEKKPIKSKVELQNWLVNSKNKFKTEGYVLIEWLLSDPLERTVTPNGKQTVKERVQQLIDIDTVASLNEALDYWPGHPMALAKLAAATLRDGKPEEREADIPRARLWANLALKYAPDDAAVRAIAEPVLRDTETKH